MAVNGRRQRRWIPLSPSTSSRAWNQALITVYSSPTATSRSGRLTSRQRELVLYEWSAALIHPLLFHLLCSLSPLGFPLLNIKPDPTESVFQSSLLTVKGFQRLVWKESRMKWSITCVCLVYCAIFFGSWVKCHHVRMHNTLSHSRSRFFSLFYHVSPTFF